MSNQVYANQERSYWLSSAGTDQIYMNKLSSPPLSMFDRGVIYELNDGHLYFNGIRINDKGDKGDKGDTGSKGDKGDITPTVITGTAYNAVTINSAGTAAVDSGISFRKNNNQANLAINATNTNNNTVTICGTNVGTASVAVGYSTDCGNNSVSIGHDSGHASANNSVFVGQAIAYSTNGSQNTYVGTKIGFNGNGSASNNVGVGYSALDKQTSASQNVCIGMQSAFSVTTGSSNVILGYQAGLNTTTGSNNIVIGDSARAASPTTNNSIVIGNTTSATAVIKGIRGVTPSAGPVQMVVVGTDGQLGSQAIDATTVYATTFSSPAELVGQSGPQIYVCKSAGQVTLTVEGFNKTLVNPTSEFVFGSIPLGYLPWSTIIYSIIYSTAGSWSTTPGILTITSSGVITIKRNVTGSSTFTGDSGGGYAQSFSYNVV